MTKYVPWAAYVQDESSSGCTLEQPELHRILSDQNLRNPYKIDLTEGIGRMKCEAEIQIHVDSENALRK